MKKRFQQAIALTITAMLLATGCGSGQSTQTATQAPAAPAAAGSSETTAAAAQSDAAAPAAEARTTANIAINRDITSLDGSGGGFSSTNVSMQVYDCLIAPDENLEPSPALATSWEMIDDLTWEFKLREGVKFHNGEDFNADSVVFSIDHYTNAIKYKYLTQWGGGWPPVAEKVDDYTVRITTAAPQPATPRLLSRLPMLPVDYAGLTQEEFFTSPIGTGAYKVTEWNQGISITLEANEDYWKGAPAIKKLVYNTVTDDNARLAGFKSGEYQIAFGIPYDQIDSINGIDGVHVMQQPTIGYDAIQFNFRFRPGSPIADERIREAMTYAIDSYGICDVIMSGYQQPAEGPAPMNVAGAYDGGGFPHRDLDKAKELMDAAGYNGEEIIFAFHSGEFTSDTEVSELVLAQLLEAGFNVTFTQVESGAWSDMKGTDQWDVTNNSVPGSFSGEAQYHYNQMKNLTGLELPEFDEIMSAADNNTSLSQEERNAEISKAMKVLWDYVPYVFGSVPTSSIAMTDDFAGYTYIPLNWLMMAGASFGN